MKLATGIIFVFFVAVFMSGCDKMQRAPRIIYADGKQYVACSGNVWVSDVSSMFSDMPVYKVSFSDLAGKGQVLWSVQDLKVSQPHDIFAPLPSALPDPSASVDIDGKSFNEGKIYSWADGSKAKLISGKWQPVKLDNACNL